MNYNKFDFKSSLDLDKIKRMEKMLKRPISIPGEYLLSGKVKDGDKIFWQFLNLVADIYGKSWWKQAHMIKITGISESTLKRNIKKLKAAGWLEVEKLEKEDSNRYKLIWPESCPNPRIAGAKKNSQMQEMQDKLEGRENRRYRKNESGGFTKAFGP
jgi:hypothetical protein